MKIPKETIDKIREELPHGAQLEIAEKTGYSKEYVNMVLNYVVPLNRDNEVIISCAQKIIRKQRDGHEKISNDLKKLFE